MLLTEALSLQSDSCRLVRRRLGPAAEMSERVQEPGFSVTTCQTFQASAASCDS